MTSFVTWQISETEVRRVTKNATYDKLAANAVFRDILMLSRCTLRNIYTTAQDLLTVNT